MIRYRPALDDDPTGRFSYIMALPLMISTLYLIQFIAFYFWQYTSKQNKKAQTGPLAKLAAKGKLLRGIGAALLVVAAVGFVYLWGIFGGSCGFVIGLMGIGCLSVAIAPFRYLRLPAVAALYVCCILFETFF